MSITLEAISKFDEEIIDTFFHCIRKISDNLKKQFDPDSPESNALFRLFCSTVKTNIQVVNQYLKEQQEQNDSLDSIPDPQDLLNSLMSSFNAIPVDNANSSTKTQNRNNKRKERFWRIKK
jgi:hypothetical protein